MPTGHDAAAVNDGWRPRRSLWAPVLANLLLGVPALAPLYSAQWLLTEYLGGCPTVPGLHPRWRAVPLQIWGLPG
jgi:hypothetical protein